MKNLFALLILTAVSRICLAQTYAIINDQDGYVNMRNDASITAGVVGRIYNGEFVCIDEAQSEANWIMVDANNNSSGYIYKSKALLIASLPALKNKRLFKNGCTVYGNKISVTIKSSAFDSKRHRLILDKNKQFVNKIDGHTVWGRDGEIPKKEITSISVAFGTTKLSIPKIAFKDLYEPNFDMLRVYMGNKGIIYIKMENSDGAGSYTVIWTIKDGAYIKRYINDSFA
jgi:hypothetical protein